MEITNLSQLIRYCKANKRRLYVSACHECAGGMHTAWQPGVDIAPLGLNQWEQEERSYIAPLTCDCTIRLYADDEGYMCEEPIHLVAFAIGVWGSPEWGRLNWECGDSLIDTAVTGTVTTVD